MRFKSHNLTPSEELKASLEQIEAHMKDSPISPDKTEDVLVSLSDWKPKIYGVDETVSNEQQEARKQVDKNSDAYVVGQVYDLVDKKKDDRALWLYDNIGRLCKWYFGKESDRTERGGVDSLGNTLLADLSQKKVVSAIKLVSESTDKDHNFPLESVALLGRMLEFLNLNSNLMGDEFDLNKISEKIYDSGLGVLKAHGRKEDLMTNTAIGKCKPNGVLATDLLYILPTPNVIEFNPNTYVADSVKSVMSLLIGTCSDHGSDGSVRYSPFPFTMKDVIGILENLYTSGSNDKYLTRVARTIILEPSSGYNGLNKQQDEALEIILDAALEIIETSGDVEALTNIMYYCKTRQYADKSGSDYQRLIEIPDLELREFPNIGAAVNRIKRDSDKTHLARYIK